MTLPISATSFRNDSSAQRLRRISGAASPYEAVDVGSGTRIVAIVPAAHGAASPPLRREPNWGTRNFSAQLLELGLKHKVEGLVRKADGADTVGLASAQSAHGQYERAQNNFLEEGAELFRFRA